MIDFKEFCDPEWLEWYLMTPRQRWEESAKVWQTYLALGGSLDPQPDSQSPFFDADEWRATSDGGRHDIVVTRRGVHFK
jgi:hypothetical protein